MLPPVSDTALKMSNELLTLNPNSRGVWTSIALDQEMTALSFGPRTSTLYLAQAPVGVNEGDTLARLPANETVPIPIITLSNERVMRLIAAPYGYEQPRVERPIVPNPLETLPAPFSERTFSLPDTPQFPQPYTVPPTRTEVITINLGLPSGNADAPSFLIELAPDDGRIIVPTDRNNRQLAPDLLADGMWVAPPPSSYIAWIGVPSAAGFDVVAIGRNGDQTLIAANVRATITRPNAPPLLLIPLDDTALVLLDPLTQSGTMFQTDADVQNCVLAPDQQRLACTARFGFLLIINLVDGTTQEINNSVIIIPFSWTDSGIYSYSQDGNTRSVWRFDPNKTHLKYTSLLRNVDDQFVIVPARGAAGDRLIYIDSTKNEVRVRDLATNTDQVSLYVGANVADVALSPDGRYIAYLRPQTDTTYNLMIADLDSETQQIWANDQPFVPNSLRWNAASNRLAYRIREPADSPQRTRLVVQSLPAGNEVCYFPLPGRMVGGMEFGSADQVIAVIYEDNQADLAFLAANGEFGRAVGVQLSSDGDNIVTLLYVP